MVGALLTADFIAPPPAGTEPVNEKFLPVFTLIDQLDAQYQRDKTLEPGTHLHLLLLGVARPFTGRQVAQHLIAACEENGRRKGYRAAVTEASGSVSQHIFRKQGYADHFQISYQDYRYEGAPLFGVSAENSAAGRKIQSLIEKSSASQKNRAVRRSFGEPLESSTRRREDLRATGRLYRALKGSARRYDLLRGVPKF
jgi:GNAT superfamily N-acetyltransferase